VALGLSLLHRTVNASDLDRAIAGQPSGTLYPRDLVLAEEVLDTLRAFRHRLRLVQVGGLEVELELPAYDPDLGPVACLLQEIGGVQKRLCRDAPAVETGAAEVRVPLHDTGVQAELTGPDRRHVAAGPRADDHDVVLRFAHAAPSQDATLPRDSF
jgi:hypothetical protein